jgi:predicted nucleic acid-binding protein
MAISGAFVIDATVLIDICHGGILQETITVLEKVIAPDLVCCEVKDVSMDDLVVLGLVPRESTGEEILELQRSMSRYPGLTHKDVSALLLAIKESATLVTGDDRLRSYATNEGVEAHGVLWVLDILVDTHLLDPVTAADALMSILDNGSWLPMAECTKRIEGWQANLSPSQVIREGR